jgi:serine/threonine protein kinase
MGLLDKFRSMMAGNLNVHARFELMQEAVFGTMSQFYKAKDRNTREVVGLKLLDREKTAAFAARFKGLTRPGEGEIASNLKHDYIVKTLEFGKTTQNQDYLVMEFLPGNVMSTLLLAESELIVKNRLELIRQMATAIQVVHDAGYIHRDICPRNFIVNEDGTGLKLIDFGLTIPSTKYFMLPGNRTGTPSYMAPEIVRRRATDHRVDVFALGVSAYQLCSFSHPWPSEDTTGRAAMQFDSKDPIPVLEVAPNLDEKLAMAIMKCLSPERMMRPESADHFLRMIESVEKAF